MRRIYSRPLAWAHNKYMAKASRSALTPHAADVPKSAGKGIIMANATIELQNQSIKIQTVPGSGLIRVFLPETDNCFYNPTSGLFSTAPIADGTTPYLVTHHLPELKQKLKEFDENMRAEITQYNRFSPAL